MRQIFGEESGAEEVMVDEIVFAATAAELGLLANGLNEALELIDARELESRFGASRAEVNDLCCKIIGMIPPIVTPPQT